jgi:hypothetical protein
MHRIQLVRRFEQHAGPMLLASCRRERGPCRILQREIQRLGMASLVLLPSQYVPCKCELAERLTECRLKCFAKRFAVERCRVCGLDLVHGLALHEVALHAEQRGKLVMPRRQRRYRIFDAEHPRDEIIDVRRERDQQFGCRLGRQCIRRLASAL